MTEVIDFMKSAGIKVWILTGDKLETAVNIAISAGILNSKMTTHKFDECEVASVS